MSQSPEKTVFGLEKQYGHEINALPELKCFPNAVRASFHIYNITNGEILPRVWRVVIPEIKDSHAYLQIGNEIYNQGVTWPDDKYPNFNLSEIKKHGLDVTTTALTQTYLEWTNKNSKIMGFKEAISSLGYSDPTLVTKILDKMIAKSVKEEKI